jgi:peroxiredoxin
MLATGDLAPELDGDRLAKLRGRWVVLFFFPKAFTAG